MFGISIAVASRPEVGSTSCALVTFAANSAAREAARAAETAVQCIYVRGLIEGVSSLEQVRRGSSPQNVSPMDASTERLIVAEFVLYRRSVSHE